jgi:hypothetical protein
MRRFPALYDLVAAPENQWGDGGHGQRNGLQSLLDSVKPLFSLIPDEKKSGGDSGRRFAEQLYPPLLWPSSMSQTRYNAVELEGFINRYTFGFSIPETP